jgi:aspartate carbamoyltransferase regulatory subunit
MDEFSTCDNKTCISNATQMLTKMSYSVTNAHNMLIRCLNSIYLQAPYVREEADVQDLLQYSLFWSVRQ